MPSITSSSCVSIWNGLSPTGCHTYLTDMVPDSPDVDLSPIADRYALIVDIPCYRDDDGSLWLEPLWHHDFVRHLEYIRDLTLVAPCLPKGDREDLLPVVPPSGSRVCSVPLPRSGSTVEFARNLPGTIARLWRAIGAADIIHSGVVGWPVPLGWLANPMALVRHKRLVIVVESAPWRLTGAAGWRRRVRAVLAERLARWAVNHASLSFFTHESYRRTMLTHATGPSAVVPATWIDERDILARERAEELWQQKMEAPVRLLFAGRLTADKGIDVLRRAVSALQASSATVAIDIVGAGEEREACQLMAAANGSVRVRLLEPVAPGAQFLELVRRYHAVLVPSLSDEQPRIVFDASSQAVPVIASSTDGLRPHVRHGETGWLFPPGDAAALTEAIERAMAGRVALARMGLAALRAVNGATHREMHRARWRLLVEQLSPALAV
jgi:glycosyltransferase involved in cell wall biosynthesis